MKTQHTKLVLTLLSVILSFQLFAQQSGTIEILNTNYYDDMTETFIINTGVAKPVKLSYSVYTERYCDFVYIYNVDNNGVTSTTPLIVLDGFMSGTISTTLPTGRALIVFETDGSVNNEDGYLGFQVTYSVDNGFAVSEDLFVSNNALVSGSIGIGTNSPTSRLDVAALNGEGIRIGKIGYAGNIPVPFGALSTQLNLDFTGYRNIRPDQVGARISALRFNWFEANNALVQKTGLAFYTNPTGVNTGITDLKERMRISPEGKIGIGLTDPTFTLSQTPVDELLTVNGTIHAKEVNVSLVNLADYVFDPAYDLMPLYEVEKFIKTNRHLPLIPSATEVQNNGMNMGEMQNKLLQKIEELTLYVIEQQKRIDQLEKKQK